MLLAANTVRAGPEVGKGGVDDHGAKAGPEEIGTGLEYAWNLLALLELEEELNGSTPLVRRTTQSSRVALAKRQTGETRGKTYWFMSLRGIMRSMSGQYSASNCSVPA